MKNRDTRRYRHLHEISPLGRHDTRRYSLIWIQVLVLAREWRFKSSHPHQVHNKALSCAGSRLIQRFIFAHCARNCAHDFDPTLMRGNSAGSSLEPVPSFVPVEAGTGPKPLPVDSCFHQLLGKAQIIGVTMLQCLFHRCFHVSRAVQAGDSFGVHSAPHRPDVREGSYTWLNMDIPSRPNQSLRHPRLE